MCTYEGQTSCRLSSPETQRWWSPTCDRQDVNKIKTLNVYKILGIDRIFTKYFLLSQRPWWSRPRCSASVGPCQCCSPSSAWERHWETICGPDMIQYSVVICQIFFLRKISFEQFPSESDLVIEVRITALDVVCEKNGQNLRNKKFWKVQFSQKI